MILGVDFGGKLFEIFYILKQFHLFKLVDENPNNTIQ